MKEYNRDAQQPVHGAALQRISRIHVDPACMTITRIGSRLVALGIALVSRESRHITRGISEVGSDRETTCREVNVDHHEKTLQPQIESDETRDAILAIQSLLLLEEVFGEYDGTRGLRLVVEQEEPYISSHHRWLAQ